ncbi:MAG: YceK/YidQ family lipoprotein [Panacagrimonas sp.]
MKAICCAAIIVVATMSGGCASTRVEGRNASGSPTLYAGTRLNVAALNEDYATLSIYEASGVHAPSNPAIDAPLSFFADTVLLPIDAWYWATTKAGLFRPTWSGIFAGELGAHAD